jgi:hypothetical protein
MMSLAWPIFGLLGLGLFSFSAYLTLVLGLVLLACYSGLLLRY